MFKLLIVALAAVLGFVAAKPGFGAVAYGAPLAYAAPVAYTAPLAYSAPYAYSTYAAAPYAYGLSTYAAPFAYSAYPYLWKKR